MAFWLGILVAGFFALGAVKIGFYQSWAMLFNITIAIFLAIFLWPTVMDFIPAAGDTMYSDIIAMLLTAIAAFVILHGISYTLITGQFNVSFPAVLDFVGSGFLGFLAGILVWNFASLLFSMTPFAQDSSVKKIGFDSKASQQANISCLSVGCNLVNGFVSGGDGYTTEKIISKLQKEIAKKARKLAPSTPADTNKPAESNKTIDPNKLNKAETTGEKSL